MKSDRLNKIRIVTLDATYYPTTEATDNATDLAMRYVTSTVTWGWGITMNAIVTVTHEATQEFLNEF